MSTFRVALYVRYSSDNQHEASIEDQIEVCRRYAELKGWTVVAVYADYAQSGASRFRSEFQQMQVDAEGGRFDLILVEALDRLSRKLADVAELFDRLSFLGIGLHTVSTGRPCAPSKRAGLAGRPGAQNIRFPEAQHDPARRLRGGPGADRARRSAEPSRPRERVVVFCDGDFWHGRDLETRLLKLARGHNASYWGEDDVRMTEQARVMESIPKTPGTRAHDAGRARTGCSSSRLHRAQP